EDLRSQAMCPPVLFVQPPVKSQTTQTECIRVISQCHSTCRIGCLFAHYPQSNHIHAVLYSAECMRTGVQYPSSTACLWIKSDRQHIVSAYAVLAALGGSIDPVTPLRHKRGKHDMRMFHETS